MTIDLAWLEYLIFTLRSISVTIVIIDLEWLEYLILILRSIFIILVITGLEWLEYLIFTLRRDITARSLAGSRVGLPALESCHWVMERP